MNLSFIVKVVVGGEAFNYRERHFIDVLLSQIPIESHNGNLSHSASRKSMLQKIVHDFQTDSVSGPFQA